MATHNIGTMIDKYKAAYDAYSAAQRAADELKSTYKNIGEGIHSRMRAEDIDRASGASASVTLQNKQLPLLKDYAKMESFIYKHKALHLLNRAVNVRAWKDYIDDRKGKPIPGITTYERQVLSRPLKPKGAHHDG